MFSFSDLIKGLFIGIACVLPGISGGALALSLGVYESILGAMSRIFTDTKNSIKTLSPFFIGCLLALFVFPYAADYLISTFPYLFAMTIGGFLFGGIPSLWTSLKQSEHTCYQIRTGVLLFFLAFFLTLLLSCLQPPLTVKKPLLLNPQTLLIMLCLGLLYSVTMILPGVSGSLLLMVFGYYYSLIETARLFLDSMRALEIGKAWDFSLILLPFFLGLITGAYLLASCGTWLFEKHRFCTLCFVLGILAASLFTIFHHMGIFSLLFSLSFSEQLIGIFLFGIGMFLTCHFSQDPSHSQV